ncbi:adenosine A2a receptor a isoform X2 [Astatotilapia calliptera]|uniref:Adenosine receptor A2 n=1 Tax=Astatotilapia calliptera TaxID=8154 RepID=A0A3P8NC58_ASTCA|nr:adenosine receptor A2a isoform X2 [Astatotilapia calliptera]
MRDKFFYITLELLIAIFSVLGNVLVCWAVALNSNLQSITNFFVVSLAVADIAVGVLAIPFAIVISIGFCSNFYGCLFIACFVLVLTQSSIFSLLAIAIDRYIAIKIPLRYNSLVTGQRARGIIAICWILSIIIGLTPMMGWHGGESRNGTNETKSSPCQPGMMECLFEDVVDMEYMVYFNFFACVLIPLLLMLAIYLCIFMAARHQLMLIEVKASHGEKSRSVLQKECDRPPDLVMYVAIILSHANSVVNPFIYAYRIREFRHTFRRIIRRHILGKREVFESSGSKRNSTHNSITDSIRLKANGLSFDLFTEHSSSTCENSCRCPAHISPLEGGLATVSHPPLSVVIAHCPKVGTCPLQALRQTQLPAGNDCSEPEILEENCRQNLAPAQVALLFNTQDRKSCCSELDKVH